MKNLIDEMTTWAPGSPFPFGKHKGIPLKDIPYGYKKWFLEQDGDFGDAWSNLRDYLRKVNFADNAWSDYDEMPIGKNKGQQISDISEFAAKWYLQQEWFRDTWPNLCNYFREKFGLEED